MERGGVKKYRVRKGYVRKGGGKLFKWSKGEGGDKVIKWRKGGGVSKGYIVEWNLE